MPSLGDGAVEPALLEDGSAVSLPVYGFRFAPPADNGVAAAVEINDGRASADGEKGWCVAAHDSSDVFSGRNEEGKGCAIGRWMRDMRIRSCFHNDA